MILFISLDEAANVEMDDRRLNCVSGNCTGIKTEGGEKRRLYVLKSAFWMVEYLTGENKKNPTCFTQSEGYISPVNKYSMKGNDVQ